MLNTNEGINANFLVLIPLLYLGCVLKISVLYSLPARS